MSYSYKTVVLTCWTENGLAEDIEKTATDLGEKGYRLIAVNQLSATSNAILTFELTTG